MPVSSARKIAFEILRRVESEGAYASELLHSELRANVTAADAALATELTLGVLRQRRLLDFLLQCHLKKPVEKLDLPVTLALRLSAYQLRFLEKIPARAAVNESVEMVKSARKSSAAPLVNAVLRKIAEHANSPAKDLLPTNLPLVERLGILHSHPSWLVERWLARFGEERTVTLLEFNNRQPRLACALNDATRRDEILRSLEKAGLRIEPGRLLKDAFVVSGGSPSRTEVFRAGQISIQDEASQAVPPLVDVHPGDRVLDLCAAPGGKTPALARAAGNAGTVVAADLHAHRLRAMAAQFERLGLAGVLLVELDAKQPLPFTKSFDRILLDAPCSGTGTLARHPEIRWRLRAEQLSEFHELQVGMLRNALPHLASGSRLVYSTCSIELEENESVVSEVLRDSSAIRRVPAAELSRSLAPHLISGVSASEMFDSEGQFHTWPPAHFTDGFFAAALELA